jgi:uncharacterized membrane protein
LYKKDNIKSNSNNEVSKDTVYSELYAEMRRYRDYELIASPWYTTILLAILGAILSVKFGVNPSKLSELINRIEIKLIIFAVVTFIGFSICYSLWYVSQRYHELRKYVDELEPKWKKLKSKSMKFAPNVLMLIIQATLTVIIDVTIFCETK